ncbi:chaperone ATPase HSP78 ASCRUDRAFT_75450 [Ascoidea rubescens DSM 1968]|uniref:P-loop containing nucleoside triphosphate hydrolase protein n=1 Tax=Ascoidea rubescens DSM 1968 TaxID=1344418 RepID=A0A1D2VIT7_9ASCO|nr:hypothetical protein ASCRUDRAFT_75450 [Ascoidea rubescens DSM 1968]ODV61433.1 hypothetical protein ASCRUDRAFT_75450 [Ascoidea rubescens DSM 1968]
MAGSKFRGDIEERLKSILNEIQNSNDKIILFIDEIHLIMNLGKTEGSIDVSNFLKPALARSLHCIGATTIDEYRKFIEKDLALARRFQKVIIKEPTVMDTISILRGLKERYEVHHGVRITDSALITAASLSNRYITDRFLPDKAIDLVDEACSSLRLQHESKPDPIQNLDSEIMTIQIELESLKKETDPNSIERKEKLNNVLKEKQEKINKLTETWIKEKTEIDKIKNAKADLEKAKIDLEAAQREGDYAKASELRYSTIPNLEKSLPKDSTTSTSLINLQNASDSSANEEENLNLLHDAVTSEDISVVISKMTGIPLNSLLKGDKDRLLYMEDSLKLRVIGQDEAIHSISDAVRLQRAGLTSEKRPIASFMFLGPTGTGKTELTKTLAEFLFDNENSIVRFDMSEFQEKHTVSRLIGAPPGYVGYENSGELTEAVRRKPYSIVLFDEFEKAHHDVSKLLLQVLDEGQLTDSQGNKIDFKNTIIVMTSNIGQNVLLRENIDENDASGEISKKVKDEVIEIMKHSYPPEFINRVDEIIVFNRLSKQSLKKIVNIRIKEIQDRLKEKKIELKLSEESEQWLVDHGYDPMYGARPLNRLIQKEILNPLARLLIKGQIRHNEDVYIEVNDHNKLVVKPNHEVEEKK